MTYVTPPIVRFLMPALVAAALSVAACGPSMPSACVCTSTGDATVTVPATPSTDPPVLILSAWTNFPCSAEHDYVGKVVVSSVGAATCQVGVILSNGDQYSFSVEFEEVKAGCCLGRNRVVQTTPPELFDGGAPDSA